MKNNRSLMLQKRHEKRGLKRPATNVVEYKHKAGQNELNDTYV